VVSLSFNFVGYPFLAVAHEVSTRSSAIKKFGKNYVIVMKKIRGSRVPMGNLDVSYVLKFTSLVGPKKGTRKKPFTPPPWRAIFVEVTVITIEVKGLL
jgi:hypothetical protein